MVDELAALSGVSRASLSRIENGEVSPTAAVLGRLATAHGLTISGLMAEVENESPALIKRIDQPQWVDPATGFRRRSVSPPSAGFDCELLLCELPARASIDYPRPPRAALSTTSILLRARLSLTLTASSTLSAPAIACATSFSARAGSWPLGLRPRAIFSS